MSLLRYQLSKKRRAQTGLALRTVCRSLSPTSRFKIGSAKQPHKQDMLDLGEAFVDATFARRVSGRGTCENP
jgi:hypothetical protein